MKDPRFKILEQLFNRLEPLDTPVYSVLPDNTAHPFIYIGDVQLSETQCKDQFTYEGFVTVELHGGSQIWVGSIAPLLTELGNIKEALNANKQDRLDLSPGFYQPVWRLSSDAGLIQYSSTERLYVATLQYSMKIQETGQSIFHTDDVVHFGVPVEQTGEQVTHTN